VNEPRTYRHSPVVYILLLVAVLLIAGLAHPLMLRGETVLLPFLAIPIAIILALAVYRLTGEVVVSDSEIASRHLWSTRSLAWRDIHRISGTNGGLKLHNFDDDVTVTLDAQLPRFEEVAETIAAKRPELFAAPELQALARNPFLLAFQILLGLGIVALDIWIITQTNSQARISALVFAAIGLYLFVSVLMAPRAIAIEGANLVVKYLAGESTLRADEIRAVQLNFHRTRNGRMYYVELNRKDGKTIRIAQLQGGPMLAYLVLREWHRKHGLNKFSV
jgi:hypothetical protein